MMVAHNTLHTQALMHTHMHLQHIQDIHTHIHTYAHYIHTYIHTYTRAHTHTHTHTPLFPREHAKMRHDKLAVVVRK